MACEYTCDGCGKKAPAVQAAVGGHGHPDKWFQRRDEDGVQDACSRECIKTIAKKTGKTTVVQPF